MFTQMFLNPTRTAMEGRCLTAFRWQATGRRCLGRQGELGATLGCIPVGDAVLSVRRAAPCDVEGLGDDYGGIISSPSPETIVADLELPAINAEAMEVARRP